MSCPYGIIWEPQVDPLERRFGSPPPPYVIEARWGNDEHPIPAGHTFAVRVLLFGAARSLVPQLLFAAVQAGAAGFGPPDDVGRRPAATLIEAWDSTTPDEPRAVYDVTRGLHPWAPNHAMLVAPIWEPGPSVDVTVSFESPLELVTKVNGRRNLVDVVTPELLTDRIGKRFAVLAHAHERAAVPLELQTLVELAGDASIVADDRARFAQSRRSNRDNAWREFRGWTGAVRYANVHPAVLALWRTAEWLHVGRNTIIGLGAIRCDVHGPSR